MSLEKGMFRGLSSDNFLDRLASQATKPVEAAIGALGKPAEAISNSLYAQRENGEKGPVSLVTARAFTRMLKWLTAHRARRSILRSVPVAQPS